MTVKTDIVVFYDIFYSLFDEAIRNLDNMASIVKTTVKMNSKICERKRTLLNIRYYTGGRTGVAEESKRIVSQD
jgi:hypothetical protein